MKSQSYFHLRLLSNATVLAAGAVLAVHGQHSVTPLGPLNFAISQSPLITAVEPAPPSPFNGGEQGRVFRVGALPSPQWRTTATGARFSLLRLASGGAACRIQFDTFHLPQGSRMLLYGVDTARAVTAVYGPYETAGPRRTGEFRSKIVPGVETVIELQGVPVDEWPFTIERVTAIDAETLSLLRRTNDPGLREQNAGRRAASPELRSAFFRGRPITYEVRGGLAFFQGDIIIGTAEEVELGSGGGGPRGERQAIQRSNTNGAMYQWPSGAIPYVISGSLYATERGWRTHPDPRVLAAIQHYRDNMPGLLKPRDGEDDYILFTRSWDREECSSYVGRQGYRQDVLVGNSCTAGNIIHEIGHAAGLYHEHQREDRDSFVDIVWDNIENDMRDQFTQHIDDGEDIGAYDYGSIMHYGPFMFSRNGNRTIVPLQVGADIGQRIGLSAGDIAGIRKVNCTYWADPIYAVVRKEGGSGTINAIAPGYCPWKASEDPDVGWVSLSGKTSGMGNGAIAVTVSENRGFDRSAYITVKHVRIHLRQEGPMGPTR